MNHVGAKSGASSESAVAKNSALREAGGHVPNSFNDFGEVISQVYQKLVDKHIISPQPELIAPEPPADFKVCLPSLLLSPPSSSPSLLLSPSLSLFLQLPPCILFIFCCRLRSRPAKSARPPPSCHRSATIVARSQLTTTCQSPRSYPRAWALVTCWVSSGSSACCHVMPPDSSRRSW